MVVALAARDVLQLPSVINYVSSGLQQEMSTTDPYLGNQELVLVALGWALVPVAWELVWTLVLVAWELVLVALDHCWRCRY